MMPVRTTAAKVKEILDTDLTDSVIEAFILGASHTIDQVFSENTTLSADHLAEIERWFTAHLIAATREQQIAKAGAGGASVTYQGVTGKGLESTMYGQQVIALDPTGMLRSALSNRRAKLIAIPSFKV